MFTRGIGRVLLLAPLCVGCGPEVQVEPVIAVVEGALPSVVLLINEREDGAKAWGSGFLVGEDGLVLTNQHVIERADELRAMLYRPERTSYTPMDGGLTRYLFENERDLIPAVVVEEEAALDLAVVRLLADTSHLPRLECAEGDVRPGQQVFALGHPQETVWSFTSGVVSALHSGAIQHDASVNTGSSGGPLVDAQGRVVGLNTSKVLGESEGVAFATPIGLALRVVDEASETLAVDLSSPERAAMSCLRAQELASAAILECYDWDHKWSILQGAARELDATGPFPYGAVGDSMDEAGGRDFWVGRMRYDLKAYFTLDQGRAPLNPELYHRPPDEVLARAGFEPSAVHGAQAELHAEIARLKEITFARWAEHNHLRAEVSGPASAQQLIKAGVRVEQVRHPDVGRAWVHLAGRNADDSRFEWSELWVLGDGLWRQHDPVGESELGSLPEGWPLPLDDVSVKKVVFQSFLVAWVAWSAATDEERAAMAGSGGKVAAGGEREPVVEVEIVSGGSESDEPPAGEEI